MKRRRRRCETLRGCGRTAEMSTRIFVLDAGAIVPHKRRTPRETGGKETKMQDPRTRDKATSAADPTLIEGGE